MLITMWTMDQTITLPTSTLIQANVRPILTNINIFVQLLYKNSLKISNDTAEKLLSWQLSLTEDTKGTIRIRNKDRQHNGQKKKDKRTNKDTHNTKD